jgi:hypothetical protein
MNMKSKFDIEFNMKDGLFACLFFTLLLAAWCLHLRCATNVGHSSKPVELVASTTVDMDVKPVGAYHYNITTSGGDPYVLTASLAEKLPAGAVVLSFEYKSPSSLPFVQAFLAEPISEACSMKSGNVPPSEDWSEFSLNLNTLVENSDWGDRGNYLRLDFGSSAGYTAEVRNIHLRSMNVAEKEQYRQHRQKIAGYEQTALELREYLSTEYPCSITDVDAGEETIAVSGRCDGKGNFSLCELAPHEDIGDVATSSFKTSLDSSDFTLTFDRYYDRGNGTLYDRTLSRWIIAEDKRGDCRVMSHARYPDRIEAVQQTVAQSVSSKKGLGGFYADPLMTSDLDELGITSVTVNLPLTARMYSGPGQGRIEHRYGNSVYYFDEGLISGIDRTLTICRDRNIVVAGIILINNAASSADPIIGKSIEHPDYVPAGYYSMPDMTTPQSVDIYAAAIDFFASRYSRPDRKYGRIHHWIMHNEVDMGFDWTNMGSDKPVELYMDAYVKSMRLCHNIVSRYDRHARVMASQAHSWTIAENPHFYPSRDMLAILNAYCRAEGDFNWGLAFHCYPADISEPKTWLDTKATYSAQTQIITYKNLEVLDAWIKLPENLYQGKFKRLLWLSENGTNSPSYSPEDQIEQAAGLAWGWKKIAALDGIDAHQWHNWGDNEMEFGLRIGLRKFAKDDRERKDVWYLYRATGTDSEDAVFKKYLPVIGIDDWNIIQPLQN